MRAYSIAVLALAFVAPSLAYAQQDGPVGGKVGSDLGVSSTQPAPSAGASAYGAPQTLGRAAGYSGSVAPGQVVPNNVAVSPRPGGTGTAFVNGHRVLVGPSNRILRIIN